MVFFGVGGEVVGEGDVVADVVEEGEEVRGGLGDGG